MTEYKLKEEKSGIGNYRLGVILVWAGICVGCASIKAKPTSNDPLAVIFRSAASIKLLSYANDTYAVVQVEGEEGSLHLQLILWFASLRTCAYLKT